MPLQRQYPAVGYLLEIPMSLADFIEADLRGLIDDWAEYALGLQFAAPVQAAMSG